VRRWRRRRLELDAAGPVAVQELPGQRLQVSSAAPRRALRHADGRAIRCGRLPELVLVLLVLMLVVVVLDRRPLMSLRRRVEERGQVGGGGDVGRRWQVRDVERGRDGHLRRGGQRWRGRQFQRGQVGLQVGQLGLEIHHLGNDHEDVTINSVNCYVQTSIQTAQ
jgi:hypothetical protein